MHIYTHTHTHDQVPLYPYSECNHRLLHPCISLSLSRLLFLCSAFLSLCVTFLLCKEPPSGLIIFGLSFGLPLNLGFLWMLLHRCTHRCKNALHLCYISANCISTYPSSVLRTHSLTIKHSDAAAFITLFCMNWPGLMKKRKIQWKVIHASHSVCVVNVYGTKSSFDAAIHKTYYVLSLHVCMITL